MPWRAASDADAMTRIARISVASPLGDLTLTERDDKIVGLDWGSTKEQTETPLLASAAQQLHAYFYCGLKYFELPLAPEGSPFQRAVWDAMRHIPYGRVETYADIARRVDSAPRAIGGACGRNPIPIIIPCHRVVGSAGRIGGYSGHDGIGTKRFLLELEGVPLEVARESGPRP